MVTFQSTRPQTLYFSARKPGTSHKLAAVLVACLSSALPLRETARFDDWVPTPKALFDCPGANSSNRQIKEAGCEAEQAAVKLLEDEAFRIQGKPISYGELLLFLVQTTGTEIVNSFPRGTQSFEVFDFAKNYLPPQDANRIFDNLELIAGKTGIGRISRPGKASMTQKTMQWLGSKFSTDSLMKLLGYNSDMAKSLIKTAPRLLLQKLADAIKQSGK